MSPYAPQGQVTEADVRAAQTIQDALAEDDPMVVRGLLIAWSAEVRAAGYTEGLLRGRRDVAGWIRDALAGEGL